MMSSEDELPDLPHTSMFRAPDDATETTVEESQPGPSR